MNHRRGSIKSRTSQKAANSKKTNISKDCHIDAMMFAASARRSTGWAWASASRSLFAQASRQLAPASAAALPPQGRSCTAQILRRPHSFAPSIAGIAGYRGPFSITRRLMSSHLRNVGIVAHIDAGKVSSLHLHKEIAFWL